MYLYFTLHDKFFGITTLSYVQCIYLTFTCFFLNWYENIHQGHLSWKGILSHTKTKKCIRNNVLKYTVYNIVRCMIVSLRGWLVYTFCLQPESLWTGPPDTKVPGSLSLDPGLCSPWGHCIVCFLKPWVPWGC